MTLNRINLVGGLRLLTLILGALITILMTRQLINIFGIDGYAKYAVITAIPSLIPFADLGLGLSVFNIYAKQHSDRPLTLEEKENISLAFYLICFFASFAFITICLLLNVQHFERLFNKNIPYLYDYSTFLILGITFFSTPLTLGFRKMYGNGNVQKAILLSFLIPFFNLILTFLLILYTQRADQWIVFAPSISYLIANLVAFIHAGVYKDLIPLTFYHFRSKSFQLLTFAWYATLFNTLIAVMLQLPKFYFANQNAQVSVSKYAILLLVGSSLGSLVSAYASVLVPTYKKNRYTSKGLEPLIPTRKISILILAIGLVGFIYGPIFLKGIFNIEFSYFEFFISETAFIVYLLWVFYNSFLTEMNDLKNLLVVGLLISLSLVAFLYITGVQSFSLCITFLFLLFFLLLLIFSVFRIFMIKGNTYE